MAVSFSCIIDSICMGSASVLSVHECNESLHCLLGATLHKQTGVRSHISQVVQGLRGRRFVRRLMSQGLYKVEQGIGGRRLVRKLMSQGLSL